MPLAIDSEKAINRFVAKIARGGPDGTCSEWTASLTNNGYGKFQAHGKTLGAHRVVWEWHYGRIPKGMYIDHMCRNRKCVNVSHLRLVTPRANILENSGSIQAINAAKTQCIRGHEFTSENTYHPKTKDPDRTNRQCRACVLERSARDYEARKNRSK